ncbi:MAG: phosphotransferase [Rhizobacter sp.]|nr:phosphotransferase [Rhizobacter sp.]
MTSKDTSALQFSGTKAVAPQHAFDVQKLDAYMRQHVAGFSGDLHVEQFKGGQSNPTFKLTAGGKSYVMRRKPPGVLLPSAHAVDREYKVISALAKTDVPVAKAYALCEDPSVIGTAFYIMDCVEGRILWDPLLPDYNNAQRGELYSELNRVMAALHSVDPNAIGLGDYGKPGNYIERQVARWTKQYKAAETETIEAADKLIEWLPKYIPQGDEVAIVHGDYRFDNVIFHPTEPRILAVLDWELSTLGHPLVDFAYHCMTWRMGGGQGGRGMAGADIQSLGIPSEAEYVKLYMERTGRKKAVSPAEWNYYMVFNMFRLVGILQGIAHRAVQGNASSEHAVASGKRARPLAEQAWALAQEIDASR